MAGFAVSYTQATDSIWCLVGDSIQGSSSTTTSSSSTTTTTTSTSTSTQTSSASSSGSTTWWVGAVSSDTSALSNDGIRATIQVIDLSTTPSQCLSFWVADEFTDSYWGQVGYYLCSGGPPIAFYQVWNQATDTLVTGGTGETPATGNHLFAMYDASGTVWTFTIDGSSIGTFNMGSSTSSPSYRIEALSEETAATTFTFSSVSLSGIQVLKAGGWQGFDAGCLIRYGVGGRRKRTELKSAHGRDCHQDSLGQLPQGTQLWSA